MKFRRGTWLTYTEYANGTELNLSGTNYWTMEDVVLRKTKEPETRIEKVELSCFQYGRKNKNRGDDLSCYDKQFGNFINMKNKIECTGKYCYRLLNENILDISDK